METLSNNSGITTDFLRLLSEQNVSIEIPLIQRDYAQGRNSATSVRENFLKTIKTHLLEGRNLNLDFVFGSFEDDKFIPIDGQQRLTTLFLLHWYIAWKTNNKNEIKKYLGQEIQESDNFISKFTYKLRTSTKDFCHAMVGKEIIDDRNKNISRTLRNQQWFYLNWENDASITGMLNTLDSIERIFTQPEKVFKLLFENETPLITFEFIPLKRFGLSDQLYIKMNARGKPLTPFENFKANIERVFKTHDEKHGSKLSDWFTRRIDSKWTDIFWEADIEKDSIVDDEILNYIRNGVITYYALMPECDVKILDQIISAKSFDFYFLSDNNLVNSDVFEFVFKSLEHISNSKNQIIDEFQEPVLFDPKELFDDITYWSQVSYSKRIKWFAYTQYLVNGFNTQKLDEWIRVIRNICDNSRIETVSEFQSAINTINTILLNAQTILEYLVDGSRDKLYGFSDFQEKEEILKAKLLLSNWDLNERIKNIENHKYLSGQISFLLDFSGIDKYVAGRSLSKFLSEDESKYSKLFDYYTNCFLGIFSTKGIKNFDDYLFERALLTFGDYTLRKNRNDSFLVNGNDRDISWKRLLRHDKNMFLNHLFNVLNLNDITGSLKTIILKSKLNDWRASFVKQPILFKYTGKFKFIRWIAEDEIYLLDKTQMNGTHSMLATLELYFELKKEGWRVIYHKGATDEFESKYIRVSHEPYFPDVTYIPKNYEDCGYWITKYLDEDETEKEGKDRIRFKLQSKEEVLEWISANLEN